MKVFKPNADYARFIRKKRAETKRALKKGDINLSKLLNDNDLYNEIISNMKVFELLRSMPKVGRVSSEKILKKLQINYCKRMGGLGKKQKKNFLNYFNIEID